MKKYQWKIVPLTLPAVIRNRPKCGGHSEYECSRNFRVNANQNHIDVWLIYQCQKCKTTWNMEILSRKDSKAINKELYEKFLQNDPELACQYAFDITTHSKNRAVMDHSRLQYEIEGDNFSPQTIMEAVEIELLCCHPIDIRLDKLLSTKLNVSRETIKRMSDQQKISLEGNRDPGKVKPKNGMLLSILP